MKGIHALHVGKGRTTMGWPQTQESLCRHLSPAIALAAMTFMFGIVE